MSEAALRLRRLVPEIDFGADYGVLRRELGPDPEATAAVSLALRHIEVHADHFLRPDVIEAAMRVAPPQVGAGRLTAELERLIDRCPRVVSYAHRGSVEISTASALGIRGTLYLLIDAMLGTGVSVLTRPEAMRRLADDQGGTFIIAPDRRTITALKAMRGVEAIRVGQWLAFMDGALMTLDGAERSRRYWDGQVLLVDRAWTLSNADALSILAICKHIGLELILVGDGSRFLLGHGNPKVYYARNMPRISRLQRR